MQTRRAGDFWRESFDIFPTPGCYMCSAKGRAVICLLLNIPNNLATAKNFLEEWQKLGKNTKSTKYQQVSTDYVICFNKLKKKVKCHCPWSDKKADSAFAATQIFYFLSVVFISQWWAPHMFIWQSWQQCKLTKKMTLIFISKEHQKDYISNIQMDHSHSVQPEASCLKTQSADPCSFHNAHVNARIHLVSRPTIWSFIYIWIIQISEKYSAAMPAFI